MAHVDVGHHGSANGGEGKGAKGQRDHKGGAAGADQKTPVNLCIFMHHPVVVSNISSMILWRIHPFDDEHNTFFES